jgi:hypothetical protein
MVVAVLVVALLEALRLPVVGIAAGEAEVFRHHPDHREELVVELHLAADGARVAAEAVAPQAVAEHHGAGRPRPVVVRIENPAERRRHRQSGEKFRRNAGSRHSRRLAAAGQVARVDVKGAERAEAVAGFFPVAVVGRRQLEPAVAAGDVVLVDLEQPLAFGIGQLPEQHVVEKRVGGRSGADAERGHRDHRGGVAGRPPEVAEGVADILAQQLEVGCEAVPQRIGESVEPQAGYRRRAAGLAPRCGENRRHFLAVAVAEGGRIKQQEKSVEPHQTTSGERIVPWASSSRRERRLISARATAPPKGVIR